MTDYNSFQESFSEFILSASGFRKVFAAGGDEESSETGISREDAAATAIIADVFGSLVSDRNGKTIAVGMDARPTGPAVAGIIIGTLNSLGFDVRYAGISAAPELMAWVKTSSDIDAFAYISASHNPIGHNGFKFGFEDGAVMGGADAAGFISKTIAAAVDQDYYAKYRNAEPAALPPEEANKNAAMEAYRIFSAEVITAEKDPGSQRDVSAKLRECADGIGIIGELNGSARGAGIDRSFFESFGFKSIFLNDKPGDVVHRIVPEGASLDLCREELEKAHAADKSFIIGYVPDNDGDRGNLVYINDHSGKAEILEAQEVFALSVKSELGYIRSLRPDAKLAVAVNGPTSMRIERIAAEYDAEVFRAEVGEANVVNLAAEKRAEGYEVRILGEGSNGGNITHPATVRDPLNTVFALIKLLAFGGYGSLTEAVDSLPAFTTTSAYEPEAKMQIGSISHAELKENYERLFPASFEAESEMLKSLGIDGWYEINYEGTAAKTGIGSGCRSGDEKGGLKIMLTSAGRDKAYLWMRGSGTEPVFRVMSDIEGSDPAAMKALLNWQRRLVAEASAAEG